jgi:hypothetical protein
MKIKIALIIGAIVILAFAVYQVSACGWFMHEDTGTRIYYDPQDRIQFIQDEVLGISRYPTTQEYKLNVYILQSSEPVRAYNG